MNGQGRLPHRQGDPGPTRHQDADQDWQHLDDEDQGHRQDDHHGQIELGEDAFDLVPEDEDLLGFCERCYRMRWLRKVVPDPQGLNGCPVGVCRSCAREETT